MQIRGDFYVKKKWGRLTRFAPTFYLHAPTLRRTCFGLTITKKEAVVEVVEGVRYFSRPSVKLRGLLGSFVPDIGPPKHIFFYFLNVNLGALPKNTGPNPMSFQFLTGGRLTHADICPLNLKILATPML